MGRPHPDRQRLPDAGPQPPPGWTAAAWLARLDLMRDRAGRQECVFTGVPVRQAAEHCHTAPVAVCGHCGATEQRPARVGRPKSAGLRPPGWGRRWVSATRRVLLACPGCLAGRPGQGRAG